MSCTLDAEPHMTAAKLGNSSLVLFCFFVLKNKTVCCMILQLSSSSSLKKFYVENQNLDRIKN